MRLINHCQLETMTKYVHFVAGNKIVGANDDTPFAKAYLTIIAAVNDDVGQAEFVGQLSTPLLTQSCGADNDDIAFTRCPILPYNETRLNGLSQAHLIGKDNAFRQWGTEGKKSRLYLMGIDIDSSTEQRLRKTF